jgi:hypothetical protein
MFLAVISARATHLFSVPFCWAEACILRLPFRSLQATVGAVPVHVPVGGPRPRLPHGGPHPLHPTPARPDARQAGE